MNERGVGLMEGRTCKEGDIPRKRENTPEKREDTLKGRKTYPRK